jgi:hypothetical protein
MNEDNTESIVMEGWDSHRITRKRKSWNESSREQIPCSLCGSFFGRRNVTQHQQTSNCIKRRKLYTTQNTKHIQQPLEMKYQPKSYIISVKRLESTGCPIMSCPYQTHKPIAMCTHFRNMHNDDCIVIREEM